MSVSRGETVLVFGKGPIRTFSLCDGIVEGALPVNRNSNTAPAEYKSETGVTWYNKNKVSVGRDVYIRDWTGYRVVTSGKLTQC